MLRQESKILRVYGKFHCFVVSFHDARKAEMEIWKQCCLINIHDFPSPLCMYLLTIIVCQGWHVKAGKVLKRGLNELLNAPGTTILHICLLLELPTL